MSRDPGLDFSFSGLKTALVYRVRELGERGAPSAAPTSPPPTSARSSSQLAAKLERALDAGEWPAVALGGGVAANAELRERAARDLRATRGWR